MTTKMTTTTMRKEARKKGMLTQIIKDHERGSPSNSQGKIFLSPQGSTSMIDAKIENLSSISAVIGGEKGLDETEERWLMDHGYKPVCLGPYILRATTAAISTAALLTMQRNSRN